MRKILPILVIACYCQPIFALDQQPDWLLNHQPNEVTGCAKIKPGKLMMAKRIALVKARTEYLTVQKADISSTIHMTEGENGQSLSQTIQVKTEGVTDARLLPSQQAKATFDGIEYWCVLISEN